MAQARLPFGTQRNIGSPGAEEVTTGRRSRRIGDTALVAHAVATERVGRLVELVYVRQVAAQGAVPAGALEEWLPHNLSQLPRALEQITPPRGSDATNEALDDLRRCIFSRSLSTVR